MLSRARRLLLVSPLVAASTLVACSSRSNVDQSAAPVTQVPQSQVKDQSIGNCWTYATVGWMESLVKSASGKELNLSESYIAYWHWFEQIAIDNSDSISEGGTWGKAAGLSLRYGVVEEGAFIADEANKIRSGRQESALAAIRQSLENGPLRQYSARQNRALVRAELDKAWGLEAGVVAQLDKVFGSAVDTTVDKRSTMPDGVDIRRVKDFAVRLKDPATGKPKNVTLEDAIGKSMFTGWDESREGTFAWHLESYPSPDSPKDRREFLRRIQKAMQDEFPVILSWYVDFNALSSDGKFLKPPTKPGSQGGHMVIFEDYEIDDVPGFGTLPVGKVETRAEALEAALSDEAKIHFFRVKNSWGTYKSVPTSVGYHDLYMDYLNGPIKECTTDANDKPILSTCHDAIPFDAVVLPAGY